MLLYPAIDLINGSCVRLTEGKLEKKRVYDVEPLEQLAKYENQGAKWAHVVDLDGAFSGSQKNKHKILEMCRYSKCFIQVGGGIRNLETIETLLSNGVKRVVLGTSAVKNPDLVSSACKMFPQKIALGVDSRDDKVSIEGWTKSSGLDVFSFIAAYEDVGVSHIIFTDISRDGKMAGPNVIKLKEILNSTKAEVISSGGISSLSDLKKIKKVKNKNLCGIIVGKAIYEQKISVSDAISVLNAT